MELSKLPFFRDAISFTNYHILTLLLQDMSSENIGEGDDSANVGPVSMLGALNHLAGGCHVPPVTLCDIETAF